MQQDIHLELSSFELSQVDEQEVLELTDAEVKILQKKKQVWLHIAQRDPESIFQDFQYGGLAKSRDEFGKNYVMSVFFEALKQKPHLAFVYLDTYKSWKDEQGMPIVKKILRFAI